MSLQDILVQSITSRHLEKSVIFHLLLSSLVTKQSMNEKGIHSSLSIMINFFSSLSRCDEIRGISLRRSKYENSIHLLGHQNQLLVQMDILQIKKPLFLISNESGRITRYPTLSEFRHLRFSRSVVVHSDMTLKNHKMECIFLENTLQ